MLITIESESLKELLDREWLCKVYGKRLEEIKSLMEDETPSNEAFKKIRELIK